MKENIYCYNVVDTITGETEERFILGDSEKDTYNYAIKSYEDEVIENLEVSSCSFVGVLI